MGDDCIASPRAIYPLASLVHVTSMAAEDSTPTAIVSTNNGRTLDRMFQDLRTRAGGSAPGPVVCS